MTSRPFDAAKAEAFADQMLGMVNQGALALMASIGHRAGLFDAMSRLTAAPSEAVAREAGLDERYVREWLGAMTTGGLVEYDPKTRCYRLPREHAAVLTRDGRPRNLAALAQWIPLLARVEDEVLACFERGGGVPSSAYERLREVMAEASDETVVAVLREWILPLVPGLVRALEHGIDVLDVGCGSGRALNLLARSFPRSRFTGYDLLPENVAAARAEAHECGLANVGFQVRDVADLEERDAFDLVTAFDAIHDQARPDAALRAVARALRRNGIFLMQEIRGSSRLEQDVAHPVAPFLYTLSCLHCVSVSLAAGGAGLGAMWGTEVATRMLGEAGFVDVKVRTLPHDPINQVYTGCKP